MKKNLLFTLFASAMMIFPLNASALVNNQGVEMTDEQYKRLSAVYGKNSVDNMSQTIFDIEKDLKYTKIATETKYMEVKYGSDILGNVLSVTEKEITEEEYENAKADVSEIMPLASCGVSNYCWETNYKKLEITAMGADPLPGSGGYQSTKYILENTWKSIPKVRSYDIMAFRFKNYTPKYNTAWGQMLYELNNDSSRSYATNYDSTSYEYNAPGGGFGISMKLPSNSNVSYIKSTLTITGNKTNYLNYGIYGTYQHASKEITDLLSKQYTISADGLGGVIKFKSSSTTSYYDGMQGVSVTSES